MEKDCERVLISEEELTSAVQALGKKLSGEYAENNPLLVCILKGSILFYADLARAMSIPCEFDFLAASSYGANAESSGALKITKDLTVDVAGRHVILVEDIIDSGNTLYRLKARLAERNPASLKIVTLLDKPARRASPIQADESCFTVEDEFLVGYGLDYAEKYRNLPYVAVLKRSIYEK